MRYYRVHEIHAAFVVEMASERDYYEHLQGSCCCEISECVTSVDEECLSKIKHDGPSAAGEWETEKYCESRGPCGLIYKVGSFRDCSDYWS